MSDLDFIEITILVAFLALPLFGVFDALRIPAPAWDSAGRSKRFWILLQVLTLYIGAIAYLAGVRRDVLFFTAPQAPDWEDAA